MTGCFRETTKRCDKLIFSIKELESKCYSQKHQKALVGPNRRSFRAVRLNMFHGVGGGQLLTPLRRVREGPILTNPVLKHRRACQTFTFFSPFRSFPILYLRCMASSDDGTVALLANLVEVISGLQATRYTSAAAAAIYVYNIFLTLDQEIEYFWKGFKFTLPNLLYICNRYLCLGFFLLATHDLAGFHDDFDDNYCRQYHGSIGFIFAHLSWTLILSLRVVALWKSHKHVVRLVWAIWACTMTAITVIVCVSSWQMAAITVYNPYIKMCASPAIPKLLAASPIAPTLYELFLTILTVIKSYNFVKASRSKAPPLLFVLMRDGVSYFVVSTTIAFGNMISWFLLPSALFSIFIYLYWALVSTVISRLVLNLRRTYYTSIILPTTVEGETRVSANITFPPRRQNGLMTDEICLESPIIDTQPVERRTRLNVLSAQFFIGYGELEVQSTTPHSQGEFPDVWELTGVTCVQNDNHIVERDLEHCEGYVEPALLSGLPHRRRGLD